MRCKICDYDVELSFVSELPGEDYCKVCEGIIMEAIRERKEMDEVEKGEMCNECKERAEVDGLPWCDNEMCPYWGGDNV